MHTHPILTKAHWYPNAQKPAPQTDSLQVPPVVEESSEDARRPSRLIDNLALATSIVESISGAIDQFPLVGPVAALLSQILKKCREVKDMHEQRDILVTRLTKTTGDLHGTIMRMEANNHIDTTGRLKTDVEEYVGLLQQASTLMSDFDGQGRLRTAALQTEWVSKFTALDRELDLFGARFNIKRLADIQIEQGVIHKKVDNGQTEQGVIHKKVDDTRIAALKEKLEKWLKSADMSDKQHETQKLRHEGTGIWFLDGRQLTEWIEKPGSLWIEGNSGTGKSVISSTVIRKLLHDRPPSDHGRTAVGYFYFDFRDDKKQLVDTMLRSVVFQLSGQSLDPYAALNSQYARLSQGQTLPTTQDLLGILNQLRSEFRRTYIVLDALDEGRDTDLQDLVELLSKLRTRTERSLHLLFTSQPREIFTAGFKGVERIVLEPETTQKDIKHFVSDEVRSGLQRLKHWGGWKPRAEEIIAKVVEKSNGMFRLAACLIIEMSRPKLEPNLDTILANLPNELYGIYDRFMETIDKDDYVYVERVLRWLLFSAQPLTLPELEDALAFDFSDPHLHVYDPAKRGYKATILCGFLEGLVVVSESATSYAGRTSVVTSLAHASVADYLVSAKFANTPTHFSHRHVPRDLIEQLSSGYPLAEYAAQYWSHHLLRCHDRAALSISTARLLVGGSRQYKTLNKLYSIDGFSPPPLYMCSLLGYREGVEYLLRNGADVNEVGGAFRYALQAASANGHPDIVWALLKNGADMNMAGGWYGSALQAAAACGHTEVVNSGSYGSALTAAATHGRTEVVRILCQEGADLNAADEGHGSALQAAAAYGRTDIVDILIENGADFNAASKKHGSALQVAAAGGHTKVVDILIEKGAKVNTIGGYYGSALQAAAACNHTEIVGILIENGADLNAAGEGHGSALHAAAICGHAEIVQILIEKGADAASNRGHLKIIQILIKKDADVNAVGGEYGSALQAAAERGHMEVVDVLIKKGADVNAVGGCYGTALNAASRNGHHELTQFLREKGAVRDPKPARSK
ncbi:ankyrin repeat-containing domain protein [Mycena rebaudengoi]|nr:ankyrin repeat-containing domain protein [Mycena rebaudengoi]